MKYIFLHNEDGKLFALNSEKVISIHDCDEGLPRKGRAIIRTGNITYYVQENMGDVVSALERGSK